MIDLSPHYQGILAAYSILIFAASSPGPSVALLMGISTGQGRGPAMITTAGIAAGSVTINVLTLLGVGLLLSQSAWAMTVLRLLGSAYLVYLAYAAFRKMVHPPRLAHIETQTQSAGRLFLAGYLLQVTNPKAIAFWLAIASIGAVDGAGLGVVIVFVMGALLISFGCHALWALALSANPVRTLYQSSRRWIEGALGAFFVFAAFKLATAER
ncbi:MAG: LysE family translocator [Pseudomonadota bacterium]